MSKSPKVRNEDAAPYNVVACDQEADDNAVVAHAIAILSKRMKNGETLDSPNSVRDFLRLKLSGLEHEVFACVFLDYQNGFIAYEEIFRGTLNQTSVYPREVAKIALHHNAAYVIFAHNHPSGQEQPSRCDELITQQLKNALALFEIKVLDHFVVAGDKYTSFSERGLL